MSRWHPLSIFDRPAERGTELAYLLGAVVPLVALGVAIERYALAPYLPGGEQAFNLGRVGTLALLVSIATLSLCCFLVVRRLVRQTIEANRNLALYDSLTGLPNRQRYHERLEKAIKRVHWTGELVAICFIDLDGFKRVNDSLGHRAGDELLMQVARRILAVVRSSDWVGKPSAEESEEEVSVSRIGGDEFTVLLNGIGVDQDAGRVARRILHVLREPFRLDRHEARVTASIGIAICPLDGADVATLLRNADTAMYSAKKNGRNGYQFYSSAMNEQAERKLEIERRLRRAIEAGEFSLCFQPIREVKSGEVRAAEVLIRLQDRGEGAIAPSEFIPIAEDTGLMVPIGAWVLRAACEQARLWREGGLRPIRLAVNVSGQQLHQPDFVATVRDSLRDSGLGPRDLELEITESTILQASEATDRAFRELHELGVQITLDDFGTGYSSLASLRRVQMDRVKIDRSFVARTPSGPDDEAVTAAIIAMAHHLSLSVVAEGVETLAQAQSLSALGCDELQGYLLSPPLPAIEFERFLTRDRDKEDGVDPG